MFFNFGFKETKLYKHGVFTSNIEKVVYVPQITRPCGNTINLEKRRRMDRALILNALECEPKKITELHRTYLLRKL